MHLFSGLSVTNPTSLKHNQPSPPISSSCCFYFMTSPSFPWLIAVAVLVSSTLVITISSAIGSLKILVTSSALILATLPLVIPRHLRLILLRKQQALPHHVDYKHEDNTSIEEEDEITPDAVNLKKELTAACGPNTEEIQCRGGEESDSACHSFLSSAGDGSSDTESVTSRASAVSCETNESNRAQSECLDFDDVSCGDGSISDEESLIEIDLPNGQYMKPQMNQSNLEEENVIGATAATLCSFQKMLWSRDYCSHESMQFDRQRRSLMMELLAEINEKTLMEQEESFIEIDISMGSVKCSRFQIEA